MILHGDNEEGLEGEKPEVDITDKYAYHMSDEYIEWLDEKDDKTAEQKKLTENPDGQWKPCVNSQCS